MHCSGFTWPLVDQWKDGLVHTAPIATHTVQGKCALLRNKLHTKSPGMDGYTYCSATQVCTVQKQVLYYRQCIKQHPLQQTGVHYTPLHCSKPSALISKSFSANTLQHTLQRTAVQNISVHKFLKSLEKSQNILKKSRET